MTKNDIPQQKKANGRYANTNYRYSDKFISRMTGWLIALIFIGPAIGIGLGILGDTIFGAGEAPGWYTVTAVSFMIGGVSLPLIVSAWFGASALNKYAGPVGLLLIFGIGALVYSKYSSDPTLWNWIGIGSLIFSTVLFFYIGFQAKVPIWLQLPMLKSPRFYISKGDTTINQDASKKK
jgi:hypothetical protein